MPSFSPSGFDLVPFDLLISKRNAHTNTNMHVCHLLLLLALTSTAELLQGDQTNNADRANPPPCRTPPGRSSVEQQLEPMKSHKNGQSSQACDTVAM
eukprot:scaffold134021_cov19-Tisochrysis_lutea.AAC.1